MSPGPGNRTRAGVRARILARIRRFRARLKEPFPVLEGNALAPLALGGEYFGTMLDAIAAARSTVDVEMYLWEDDALGLQFVDALAAAAGRGVAVRVLADAYGAREVIGAPLRRLTDAGGDVRVYNPFRIGVMSRFLHRTHKKLLIVDGGAAYAGGAGFSSSFSSGKRRERPWHDRMFEIRGPVVGELTAVFVAAFYRWAPLGTRSGVGWDSDDEPSPAAVGPARLRVLRGFPDARDFQVELLRAVDAARERVWIGTPYFIPRALLKRRLRGAMRRGVDVQVVAPAASGAHPLLWYASRRHYGDVLRLRGRIFEFGPEFYHAKLAVIDRGLALIGSSNLDSWSWRRNAELDIAVHDADSVERVAACFEADRARSSEVTFHEHRTRSTAQRAYESVAGLFDPWL